jgi:hypothetical protein
LHEKKYIRGEMTVNDDKKGNKDVILQELSKTITRLSNNGVNVEGLYYGIRDYGAGNSENEAEDGKFPWREKDEFIKVFPKEIAEIAPMLSGTEIIIVMLLMNCMSYSDGLLRKGGKGKPVTMEYIEKLTGYSKKTVIKAMANLVRARVYFYGRTGRKETDPYQFYVNPYIFFKGKYINSTLVSMFKDYKKEDL